LRCEGLRERRYNQIPIIYSIEKKDWQIVNPSKEELQSIIAIGKSMIVEGLAGSYTNDKYKVWLEQTAIERMFSA